MACNLLVTRMSFQPRPAPKVKMDRAMPTPRYSSARKVCVHADLYDSFRNTSSSGFGYFLVITAQLKLLFAAIVSTNLISDVASFSCRPILPARFGVLAKANLGRTSILKNTYMCGTAQGIRFDVKSDQIYRKGKRLQARRLGYAFKHKSLLGVGLDPSSVGVAIYLNVKTKLI